MRIAQLRRSPGFTLIELLVVIAIISVLTALLFTALSGTRQKSMQTISVNNLKQWGSAMQMSLSDFEGLLPSDGMGGGKLDLKDNDAWFNRLPPYLKMRPLNDEEMTKTPPKYGDRSIWVNPVVPESAFTEYNDPPEKYLFSYAMNDYLSGSADTDGAGAERTIPRTRIENPTGTIFMIEQGSDKPAAKPDTINAFFGAGDPKKSPENAAHIVFLDGRVELVPRSKWDPEIMKPSAENPSTEDKDNLNRHLTFIPFTGALP